MRRGVGRSTTINKHLRSCTWKGLQSSVPGESGPAAALEGPVRLADTQRGTGHTDPAPRRQDAGSNATWAVGNICVRPPEAAGGDRAVPLCQAEIRKSIVISSWAGRAYRSEPFVAHQRAATQQRVAPGMTVQEARHDIGTVRWHWDEHRRRARGRLPMPRNRKIRRRRRRWWWRRWRRWRGGTESRTGYARRTRRGCGGLRAGISSASPVVAVEHGAEI